MQPRCYSARRGNPNSGRVESVLGGLVTSPMKSRLIAVPLVLLAFLGGAVAPASASGTIPEPSWTPFRQIDLGTDEVNSMASAGGHLWVSESWQSGRLFRVNPSSGSFSTVDSGTSGIVLQEHQGRLFMAGWAGANPGSMSELSPSTGAVIRRARVCPGSRDGPSNFWVDDRVIAVPCSSGTLVILDTTTFQTVATTSLSGRAPFGVTRSNDEYWISSYAGTVTVLDASTLTPKGASLSCPEAWTMWSVGNGRILCQSLSQAVIFDSASKNRIAATATPSSAYGAYVASQGLLVTGYEDGRVGFVDLQSGALAWTYRLATAGLVGAFYDASGIWVGDRSGILRNYRFANSGGGSDEAAPVVVSADVPAEVAAGESVTVRWRLTDASGVNFTTAWIRGPSGAVVPSCGGNPASRVSGTATDGTYTQTCVIARNSPSGRYTVSVQASDTVGNSADSQATSFSVTGGGSDEAAPVVVSADVPAEVAAGESVTVRWRLTDASGVNFTTAWIRGPSGAVVPSCGGNPASRVSGTATDGTYTQTCVIARNSPSGRYTVSVQASDTVGNSADSQATSFSVTGEGSGETPPDATSSYRLGSTLASPQQARPGSRVSISAKLEVLMTDGTYAIAPDGTNAFLQVQQSGRWVDVTTANSRQGLLKATILLRETSLYRFVLDNGVASRPTRVEVVETGPDQLSVRWPQRVVGEFSVRVTLRHAEALWQRAERVVLEVRPSGQNQWRSVAQGQTRRGSIVLSTKQLVSGTWRVSVPSRSLEDSRVYGTA